MAFLLPQQVVRRSGRIPKEISILLIGSDLGGKIFSESTKTVLLSLHGAGVISRHRLSPEQELVLRWPERNRETEIRVVGQVGVDSGGYTYGAAFYDHVENFWEMEFPSPSGREQEFGVVYLVCNICQTGEKIDEHSIEPDVCATNDGVLRYCKRCGSPRFGKYVSPAQPTLRPSPQCGRRRQLQDLAQLALLVHSSLSQGFPPRQLIRPRRRWTSLLADCQLRRR